MPPTRPGDKEKIFSLLGVVILSACRTQHANRQVQILGQHHLVVFPLSSVSDAKQMDLRLTSTPQRVMKPSIHTTLGLYLQLLGDYMLAARLSLTMPPKPHSTLSQLLVLPTPRQSSATHFLACPVLSASTQPDHSRTIYPKSILASTSQTSAVHNSTS